MMNNGHGMEYVTVKRQDLLNKIKINRARHREVFEEAIVNYRAAMIEELDRMIADAKAGRKIRRHIALPEPEDHIRDYDRIITMLEMSVHNEITISQSEFASYVLDDWTWKRGFVASNMPYSPKAGVFYAASAEHDPI